MPSGLARAWVTRRWVPFFISVFWFGVNRGGGRPRSRQEGAARVAERPHGWRSGARGRSLLTHGGGRDAGGAGHFLAPFGLLSVAVVAAGSLVSAALILR